MRGTSSAIIAVLVLLSACDKTDVTDNPEQRLSEKFTLEDSDNIAFIDNAKSIVGKWRLAQINDKTVDTSDMSLVHVTSQSMTAQIDCRYVRFAFKLAGGRFDASEAVRKAASEGELSSDADCTPQTANRPQALLTDYMAAMDSADQIFQRSDGALIIRGKGQSLTLYNFEEPSTVSDTRPTNEN